MNEEELKDIQKTELVVEQTDLDLILGLPVFKQLENVDSNTSEILTEIQKLNEFLIPTPEEVKEIEALEKAEIEGLELEQVEEQAVLEEQAALEELEALELEEEVVVDYDPLILEQLEILNAHMVEEKELLNESNVIGVETAWLLVVTIVIAIGAKVLVDQITKW